MIEEIFLPMANVNAKDKNFSAQISIAKWFGDISIKISALGENYNPFADIDELTPESEEYLNLAILNAYRKQIKISRKNGKNVITIKLHKSEHIRTRRTIFGLLDGVIIGMLLKFLVADSMTLDWIEDDIFTPIQTMLVNVLVMITAPMIFFSVLSGFSGITNTASLSSLNAKLVVYSLPKLAFCTALGLFLGNMIGGIPNIIQIPTQDIAVQNSDAILRDLIVGIVPENIVTPFNTNNILQMLFMACFFGILLSKMGSWADWGRNGIDFFNRFFMEIVNLVTLFIPILVLVSMIKLTLHIGVDALIPFGKLIIATVLGLPLAVIFSALLISIRCKLTPLPFIKKMVAFLPLPFALSDSTASMPATFTFCKEKLGMNPKFTSFTIPVGMQLNMDGTAYYVAIISMIMAHTFEINIDWQFCISFFLAHFIISLTGIGILAMPPIYAAFGIPEVAIAMVIGVEPILDMFGTAQSVTGNVTASFLVCNEQNAIDKNIYSTK